MDRDLYQQRLHEALSKAMTAQAANVREAYFDLACFYRQKLGGDVRSCTCSEICLPTGGTDIAA